MIDSDELLSKADALLARWRSGAVVPRPPADYPVLTEVVKISAAESGTPMPGISAEPDITLLDAGSSAAGAAAPMEIPADKSPAAPSLGALSTPATGDSALAVPRGADEPAHLLPPEASTAPVDAGVQALEERVRLRVLEAMEPLVGTFLEERLRLRVEELARRLAATIAQDARNDILMLVRDTIRRAVARELKARRDE